MTNEIATLEKKRNILRERAQKLAAPLKHAEQDGNTLEALQFRLAKGMYAIESEYVREIHRLKDFTPLPTTPTHIIGLINVRRRITPVVDLQVLFGLPKQEATIGKTVIILENKDIEFAILIDEIIGVGPISLNAIEFSLPSLTEQRELFLKGITTGGVAILDGNKLINNPRIVVNDSVD